MRNTMRTLDAKIVVAVLLCGSVCGLPFTGALAQELSADSAPLDRCVACHFEEDYMPEGHSDDDIHMKQGLSCAGCHGGDPTSDDADIAMSEDVGFVGVPEREEISEFCGKCHSAIDFMRAYQPRIATDQVAQYATSGHGQALADGDEKVAVCTSCHTSHAIISAKDVRSSVHPFNVPATCNECHGDAGYMADYGIRTDQYDKFAESVHGKALIEDQDTGAPACNDCHGNHGAMPPGITSVRQVCGNCHVNNALYFAESNMGLAFAEQELHGCEECHANHAVAKTSDDMIGTHDDAVCMECHDDGDKGYAAAGEIHGHLTELVTLYEEAEERQREVRRIGMDDEEIGFLMQESHQSLIQARTLVHTFDPEKVQSKTDEGKTKAIEAVALAAAQVKDHRIRRRGFGFATLFTTILAIALFLKIRSMEMA
jgi:hypothetical protein